MTTTFQRVAAIGVAVLISAGALAACGANEAAEGGDDPVIALLLPETKTTRYETFDKPLFEAKVKELCEKCEVKYFNADGKKESQAEQVDSAITQGADVVVLDPVDGKAAASAVKDAQAEDIPVIAYDRFIEGADYYLSFDNQTVGRMQGEALIEAMHDKGNIIMLNGDPKDPNAAQFKKGAHEAIDKSNLKVLAEYDNPDWSPDNANQFTTDQLTRFGSAKIQRLRRQRRSGGWCDQRAEGGQHQGPAAGHRAGRRDRRDPADPRRGADDDDLQADSDRGRQAAEVAVALANGDDVSDATDFQGVKSFIFDPIVVTKDNVADTVVADKFYTVEQICTAEYADACAAAGLK